MTGEELISCERVRQINVEGWTPEHDDEHKDGELLQAANCYAALATEQLSPRYRQQDFDVRAAIASSDWPVVWDGLWWKPSEDPVRNLVKAGALIAAEIDRLQRIPKSVT